MKRLFLLPNTNFFLFFRVRLDYLCLLFLLLFVPGPHFSFLVFGEEFFVLVSFILFVDFIGPRLAVLIGNVFLERQMMIRKRFILLLKIRFLSLVELRDYCTRVLRFRRSRRIFIQVVLKNLTHSSWQRYSDFRRFMVHFDFKVYNFKVATRIQALRGLFISALLKEFQLMLEDMQVSVQRPTTEQLMVSSSLSEICSECVGADVDLFFEFVDEFILI